MWFINSKSVVSFIVANYRLKLANQSWLFVPSLCQQDVEEQPKAYTATSSCRVHTKCIAHKRLVSRNHKASV